MTITLSPRRAAALPRRSPHRQPAGRLLPQSSGPCCSLKARPQPQPEPAPSWEDLLGQR